MIMKSKRLLSALVAAGLGLVALTQVSDALAGPKGKGKKDDAPEAPAETPQTTKPIAMPLAGLAWGQSQKQVAEAIDKVFDEDYKPLYAKVQPGVQMKTLDAQLAEEKDQFRRSRIDFGKLPTGYDNTPLRGEFTYNNKESMMKLDRKGESTYFFFIQNKLWKIIDEHKLGASSSFGKDYMDAIGKLATTYGTLGHITPPDAAHASLEVDWKDATTHVRAIQRSPTTLALAFEDSSTLAILASLRPNKPVDDSGVDPDVAAAVRKGGEPPPPPPEEKKDKKKK
jgi:hypothetical protein